MTQAATKIAIDGQSKQIEPSKAKKRVPFYHLVRNQINGLDSIGHLIGHFVSKTLSLLASYYQCR